MPQYRILLHNSAYQKVQSYLNDIRSGVTKTGSYLHQCLDNENISGLSTEEFLESVVNTKLPQIFAESEVRGDGSDWNLDELSILGDICVAVPVTVYDNGEHSSPKIHEVPFDANLLFVPGALLRNDTGNTPADWNEVTVDGEIDYDAYYYLYERRLLPLFIYADKTAESHNISAFITIQGIGCGQFAGKFNGRLGPFLKRVLVDFLNKYGKGFSNIEAVYFDPYNECDNERHEIHSITFFVRPLTMGNENKPQLCKPQEYAEADDEFSNCELFSFVAWDHVSWPGNDFYTGYRGTDDGVKAASTNSMAIMTGIEGNYNTYTNTYDPPKEYRNWKEVVLKNKLKICVRDIIYVLPGLK